MKNTITLEQAISHFKEFQKRGLETITTKDVIVILELIDRLTDES